MTSTRFQIVCILPLGAGLSCSKAARVKGLAESAHGSRCASPGSDTRR